MQTRVVVAHPWEVEADVLAVPIAKDGEPSALLAALDARLDGILADLRTVGEQRGSAWSGTLVRGRGSAAGWILAMGTGSSESGDPVATVRYGAAIERRLAGRSVRRLAVWLPTAFLGADAARTVELVVRGVVEGSTEPAQIYRAAPEGMPPVLDELVVVVEDGDRSTLAAAAERGRIIGEGSNRARRLSQRAANDVSPEVLADEASAIAKEHGLTLTILGPEEAGRLGMGMFLSVGRGSSNPPRFIALRSGAAGSTDARGRLVALVGKGVCFDTGGISIKPADRMEEMKMDKTGACTVLAAIDTVSRLAPGTPLLAVAPAVENMPGPHATRPGDVVRALNGKVVEVNNTDAEGRLILGDAMTWAEQQGATHLVDVATLTGAVERALGKQVTGAFTTSRPWWDEVAAAGDRQGERTWLLPLVDDYRPLMDSAYADLVNTGGAEGSLITSAIFLREFVTKPWVHLDIAGTAYHRKPFPWAARGATGVSHPMLVELALAGAAGAA